jgi:hypothetical protein
MTEHSSEFALKLWMWDYHKWKSLEVLCLLHSRNYGKGQAMPDAAKAMHYREKVIGLVLPVE